MIFELLSLILGFPNIDKGRFDIITARPSVTLETYGKKTYIKSDADEAISEDDPFHLVRKKKQT